MANRNIDDLTPQMTEKAKLFINLCKSLGVKVVIYNTTRTLEEQARLYRQGRTYLQIKNKMYKMRKRGFGYLADIIDAVGPQRGTKIVTKAGPAESWHNFGEAFDAVPVADIDFDGDLDALWNNKKYAKEWDAMLKVGIELGLNVGGLWKNFKDFPHFQLRKGKNPTRVYTPDDLKCMLIKRGLLKEIRN